MVQKLIRSDLPAVVIATTSFYFRGSRFIRAGDTILASDVVVKRCPDLFRPFEPTHGSTPAVTVTAPVVSDGPGPDESEAE